MCIRDSSISAVIKDILSKIFNKKDRKVETSLIEEFSYPKLGPGQLWEVTAEEIKKLGGTILMNSQVIKIHKNVDNKVTGVTYIAEDTEPVSYTHLY